MSSWFLVLILGLLAHAHSSTHDADDFNERDIAARSEGYDPSDNGLEGDGVADLRLDDAFEDDDINNELDNNEREAEDGERRLDARPGWIRRLVRKVVKHGRKVVRKVIKKVKKIFRRKVCYKTYGCFKRFKMPWDLLPQSPRKVNTKFYLYTRENRNGKRIYPLRLNSLKFKNRKTIIIVHGWKGHYAKEKWIRLYAALFLKRGNFNVIGVYWGGGARVGYFTAAGNTRLVAAQIAYLVKRLRAKYRLCCSNVHVIGYSLGAHIAGYAGRRLRLAGCPIARITGLDPAGPVFARRSRRVRLDSSDANFVDVLHTSYLYFRGIKGRCGDVDFYVNGGGAQPGCAGKSPASCSHGRVVDLFKNTILPKCRFKAYKCSSYLWFLLGKCRSRSRMAYMGYDVSKRARGKYYLLTESKEPYCYYY